jgi:ribonuclease VapC
VIVDSSALISILRGEDDAPYFARALRSDAVTKKMSAANYFEASIVVDGQRDAVASRRFDELIAKVDISVVSVTAEHAMIARAAYRDFGRGSGHPAQLNFGDCFAYVLAKSEREPLLFKGDDFQHTDVKVYK